LVFFRELVQTLLTARQLRALGVGAASYTGNALNDQQHWPMASLVFHENIAGNTKDIPTWFTAFIYMTFRKLNGSTV
jgi:hypothetical protein